MENPYNGSSAVMVRNKNDFVKVIKFANNGHHMASWSISFDLIGLPLVTGQSNIIPIEQVGLLNSQLVKTQVNKIVAKHVVIWTRSQIVQIQCDQNTYKAGSQLNKNPIR